MSADEYVIFNKRLLKVVGLYPINSIRYLVCLFFMSLLVMPQLFQLYSERNDFSAILETRIGRNVTRGYFFLIINTLLIFFTLQPLKSVMSKLQVNYDENFDVKRSFPFPAKYPKFCYESPFYEITYGSQTVAACSCGLVLIAMDALIATALFHTCGHFKILHDNLLNLDNYGDEVQFVEQTKIQNGAKYWNDESINLHKRLATLVNYHQLLIRFSDCMEEAFSPIMFLQVLASSLLICLVGFQVSLTISENTRLVEYLSYLVMALFQILLFCWPGDEIIYDSSMVGDAAFSIKWYNASNHMKMGVGFIILQSQRPKCLTAGKFYKMSMENFGAILSKSLSYLMLLRSVNSD